MAGQLAHLVIVGHHAAKLRARADIVRPAQIDKTADVATRNLRAGDAEDAFGGRVEALDAAAFVQRDDADHGGVEDRLLARQRTRELLLGELLLGHVAADEDVLLRDVGPHAGPGERHETAVVVDIARLEGALGAAAAHLPHVLAGVRQVFRVDEFDGAPADHLLRLEAQDVRRARADLEEFSAAVGDQDEIERRVEQPAALDHLLLDRGRLFVDVGHHAGEGARQHADLAAGVERRLGRLAAAEGFDGLRSSATSGRASERDSTTARISARTTASALAQSVACRTVSDALMIAEYGAISATASHGPLFHGTGARPTPS